MSNQSIIQSPDSGICTVLLVLLVLLQAFLLLDDTLQKTKNHQQEGSI